MTRRRRAGRPGPGAFPSPLALMVALLLAPVPGGPALAEALVLPPGAELRRDLATPLDSYPMPVGPHGPEGVATEPLEGAVTRQAWRIPGTGASTLQILAPLRDQLREAGYEILFSCETAACGGFDFRFGTQVIGAPEMYVDLGDFRFLAARKAGGDGASPRHVTLLVSRSRTAGYVQVVRVDPPAQDEGPGTATGAPPSEAPGAVPAEAPGPVALPSGIAAALAGRGRAVLEGLTFDSGAARLSPGSYPALDALAGFLAADPARRVALVGHTDATGDLAGNMALSRRRAEAVRDRLLAEHGVRAGQVTAEGMGYLAPIAGNGTAEGREANRRVEAVLIAPLGDG